MHTINMIEEGTRGQRIDRRFWPAVLRPGELPSQLIADLRQETKTIKEQNAIFSHQKHRGYQDHAANERRKIRLEEIIQQLAALRCKGGF